MLTASDVELVDRTVRGDRQAFGQLVERHQSLVCSVAYCIVGDFARSEDVAQDAFLSAWRQLPELRERAKFASWVCGMARNLSLMLVRRERKTEPLETAVQAVAAELSPADQAAAHEEDALVWQTLQSLPETYREPLVLFYREQNSVARVAKAMELSEDAVKQRLSRGRELLREEIVAAIERTLRRTAPKAAFVLAVMGALPGIGAATASAASVAAAGKASAPLAASSVSFAGPLVGGATGLFGALFGIWMGDQAARYERERQIYRKGMLVYLLVWCLIFPIPFLAMVAGWNPVQTLGPVTYGLALTVWNLTFSLGGMFCIWRLVRRMQQTFVDEAVSGAAPLPPSPVQRFLSRYEGRSWTSRVKLFGLPLIDIQTQDPSVAITDFPLTSKRPFAKGWIAIGDRACGLIAIGGVAFGGIAIGGVCVGGFILGGVGLGLVSLCGLSAGALAVGGMAIGWAASGGLAIGWHADGGAAIAWRGANGGLAIAHDFAIGGTASAIHANDAEATAYFESTFLSRIAPAIDKWTDFSGTGLALLSLGSFLIAIVFCLFFYRLRVRKRA